MSSVENLSNTEILKSIGRNLERMRIESSIPDAEVISRGGIKKDSWYNLKSGKNVTLVNLVKALRGLKQLELIKPLVEEKEVQSPMEQVREAAVHFPKRIRRPSGRKIEQNEKFRWGDEK